MRGGQGQPIRFTFLNITPKGRDCLSELQERLPVSRFKAKMEDLLWVIITAAITAAVTAVVTTVTMKALTKP